MLIAEELLLLGNDPNGKNLLGDSRQVAVGGALLSELAVGEQLGIDLRHRLVVVGAGATGDELLDLAMLAFREKVGKKPKDVLNRIGKDLTPPLLERLAKRELLRPEPVRGLGITWTTRWLPVTPGPHQALAVELGQVVTGIRGADARTGSLVSILNAVDALHKVVPEELRGGMKRRELKRAAKEITEGRWASEAVVKAVQEAAAAASAAVIAVAAGSGN